MFDLFRFLFWFRQDDFFTGESCFSETGNNVSYKHAAFCFTRCSLMDLEFVWITYRLFLSAFWTLILTAPIHCRGSIGEQVMKWYISHNLFWWRTTWMAWEGVHFQQIFILKNATKKNTIELYLVQDYFIWMAMNLIQGPFQSWCVVIDVWKRHTVIEWGRCDLNLHVKWNNAYWVHSV